MYNKGQPYKTTIRLNQGYVGETIELKVNRIVNNKEPITDGAPLIYTDRKMGVEPDYNIRTDRFEVAIEAMDKVAATHIAKRDQRIGERSYDTMSDEQQNEFNKKYPDNKHNKGKENAGTAANTSDS